MDLQVGNQDSRVLHIIKRNDFDHINDIPVTFVMFMIMNLPLFQINIGYISLSSTVWYEYTFIHPVVYPNSIMTSPLCFTAIQLQCRPGITIKGILICKKDNKFLSDRHCCIWSIMQRWDVYLTVDLLVWTVQGIPQSTVFLIQSFKKLLHPPATKPPQITTKYIKSIKTQGINYR